MKGFGLVREVRSRNRGRKCQIVASEKCETEEGWYSSLWKALYGSNTTLGGRITETPNALIN